jgi:hypothetical protein
MNTPAINDTDRLDWVMTHSNFNYDFDWRTGNHWITAWVFACEPGNNGNSGHFYGGGEDFRDCIDKFITGQIKKLDC